MLSETEPLPIDTWLRNLDRNVREAHVIEVKCDLLYPSGFTRNNATLAQFCKAFTTVVSALRLDVTNGRDGDNLCAGMFMFRESEWATILAQAQAIDDTIPEVTWAETIVDTGLTVQIGVAWAAWCSAYEDHHSPVPIPGILDDMIMRSQIAPISQFATWFVTACVMLWDYEYMMTVRLASWTAATLEAIVASDSTERYPEV